MAEPRVVTDDGSAPPTGLVDTILAYESALASDDRRALIGFFERGNHTVGVGGAGVVTGLDAIAAAAARRTSNGSRRVESLLIHRSGPGVAHVVAVNRPERGGTGTVTQLWRQGDDGRWRIAVAHGSAPGPAVDARVWRLVGAPLVMGAAQGVLAGHTIAVKDVFAIAGMRRGMGVRAYVADAPIEFETAPAVRALLDAGAEVVGIAQTDQFAYSIAGVNPDYGTPPNPAVPGAIPGGSSSGPAAAVSLGQASIGVGTDTAGSIRIPASYQGLWGLRPTHGAIPLTGVAPLAPGYDTVGYLTRDGETLLTTATVGLTGAPFVRPSQRVFLPDADVTPDPDVATAFRDVVTGLVPNAERVSLPDLGELYDAFRVTQQAQAWRANSAWVTSHPGALAADIAARFAAAQAVTPSREAEAIARRDRLAEELDALLGDAVLLIPAASSAAPLLSATDEELEATRVATLGLTSIAGITGRPALSVPLMRVPGGPVGVSLVGPRGSDLALIRMALAWARNIGAAGNYSV